MKSKKNKRGWWVLDDEVDIGYTQWSKEMCDWQDGLIPFSIENVKQRKVAIDIGAGYGAMTWGFSKSFETVHAFEINPRFIEPLKKNLIGCDNVIIHNVGLGEKSKYVEYEHKFDGGRSKINLPENSFSNTRFGATDVGQYELSHGKKELKNTLNFQIKKLDDYEFDRVDLIKIDVENYETFVVYGALETIKKHKPVIICEIHVKIFRDIISFLLVDILGYEKRIGHKRDHKYVHPDNCEG
jgi:FkbM family methyltransferase